MMDKREWMLQAALTGLATRVGGPAELSEIYDAICAATPTVADEGWMEHDGDVNKAPSEDSLVEYRYRADTVSTPWKSYARDLAWDHDGGDGDIVRWRYV